MEEKLLTIVYKDFGNGLYAEMMKSHKDDSWEIWIGHVDYAIKKMAIGCKTKEEAEENFNLLMLLEDLAAYVNEEFGA